MKRRLIIILAVAAFAAAVLLTSSKWDGDATEAVAEPLARQAGVEETRVLPWNIEGDLQLFVFLAGGAAAGFAAGYYWRKFFSQGPGQDSGTR